MSRIAYQVLLACLVAGFARAEIVELTNNESENLTRPVVVVISANWISQIPPTGPVNAPEFLSTLYPGQKIALGLLAEGSDRDRLLQGSTVRVRFNTNHCDTEVVQDLKPVAQRHLKAEGADFVLGALKAVGIGDSELAKVEEASSVVSLTVFEMDWVAPAANQPAEVKIRVDVSGTGNAVSIEPEQFKIKTLGDWMEEPAPTEKEINKQMKRFLGDMPPGQLLSWFVALAKSGRLNAPPAHAFFVFAFDSNPASLAAAIDSYPTLEPEIQPALLWVLRLCGQDLNKLFPTLTEEVLAPFKSVEPLADPRELPLFEDPVDPKVVAQIEVDPVGWTGGTGE